MKSILLQAIATYLLIIVFSTFSHSSWSQNKFLPGKLSLINGQDLEGKIKYLNWENSPRKISIQVGDKIETFTTNEVKNFEVQRRDGEVELYEQIIFDKDISPFRLNELSTSREPVLSRDTVLLKVLLYGPINLYHFKEPDSKVQFIVKKGTEVIALLNHQFLQEYNSTKIISSTRYKTQLGNLISDCEKLDPRDLIQLKYKQKELVHLLKIYRDCFISSLKNEFSYQEEKNKVNFYVQAGIDYHHLRMETFGTFFNPGAREYNSSIQPRFGIGINMVAPRTSSQLILAAELAYQVFNFTGDNIIRHQIVENIDQIETTFKGYYLSLNLKVNYKLSVKDKSFYVFAGPMLLLPRLQTNQSYIQEVRNGMITDSYNIPGISQTRVTSLRLMGGIGQPIGRLRLEVYASIGDGFSSETNFAAREYSFSFNVAYDF